MQASSVMRTLANVALMIAIVYCALVVLLFFFQSRLLYFPQVGREVLTTPRAVGLDFQDVWLDVEPAVRLHGWYVPRVQPKGVALVLHGNAGSIALRIDWLRMFHDLGYAALVIDYRGYGRSTGSPSEEGTYKDARAAWDYLVGQQGWRAHDIVILGESLGGAIAASLAARTEPRALLLQAAFTSVPDVAQQIYPILPMRWISRYRYDTRAFLSSVSAPIFIAHSRGDEIIPFSHGQALYTAARTPKQLLELSGGHNEGYIFSRREWINALATFLEAHSGTYSKSQ